MNDRCCGDCRYWGWFETNPEFPEQELGVCWEEEKSGHDVRYISDKACRFWEATEGDQCTR